MARCRNILFHPCRMPVIKESPTYGSDSNISRLGKLIPIPTLCEAKQIRGEGLHFLISDKISSFIVI